VEDNHRGGLTAAEAALKYLDAEGIPLSHFMREYVTEDVVASLKISPKVNL